MPEYAAPTDPAAERREVLREFTAMLSAATGDGSAKRQRGEKPSWKVDKSHEAAIFSHLNKWKHGELTDPDSGVHPLVHLAWRALAIAYQETNVDKDGRNCFPSGARAAVHTFDQYCAAERSARACECDENSHPCVCKTDWDADAIAGTFA